MNKASNANKHRRKTYLSLCILFNLSILFVFKYLNFITEFVFALLELCNLRMPVPHFCLLLPVGISFYTFQLSDIPLTYIKKRLKPKNLFMFMHCLFPFFRNLLLARLNEPPICYASSIRNIHLIPTSLLRA